MLTANRTSFSFGFDIFLILSFYTFRHVLEHIQNRQMIHIKDSCCVVNVDLPNYGILNLSARRGLLATPGRSSAGLYVDGYAGRKGDDYLKKTVFAQINH